MPRLRFWIGLLAGCAAALPAFGQIVHYGDRQEISVAALPLSLMPESALANATHWIPW